MSKKKNVLPQIWEPALLLDSIPGGIHRCANDTDLTLLDMSSGFLSLFGYTREEITTLFQDHYMELVLSSDRDMLRTTLKEQLAAGKEIECEYRVSCKGGKQLWILEKGRLITAPDGTQSFTCMLVDITASKQEQEQLRLSLEQYQVIMDQATDIIFEWDIWKDKVVYSPNWEKKFGYSPISMQASNRISKSTNIHPEDMAAFLKLMEDTAAGVPYSETEFRIRDCKGGYTWCRVRATTQFNQDGLPIKAVGVIVDVDSEKKQREFLLEQTRRDALTGIYNKHAANVMVEEHLHSHWDVGAHALMIVDVDNFKAVNDTYGHLCGDAVLSDVAGTLKSLFRSSDVVGRIGGDEFLVFLPDVGSREAARKKAEEAVAAVGKISPAPGAPPVSCSIGAVFSAQGGADYDSLFRCADQALYQMKNGGRGGVIFYDPAFHQDAMPSGYLHSSVSEVIDSEGISAVDEQLAQYAFRMLYAAADIQTAIQRILEIVGRAYDISRVYIFESTEDGRFCSNTFEWCNDGVSAEIDNLQHISYADDLVGFLDHFNEHGVFYCRDISTLHPKLYGMLAPQGIAAVLQCAIRDDGCFRGYVGFDECRAGRYWTKAQIDSLSLVATVLSTFLIKLRLKEQLAGYRLLTQNPCVPTDVDRYASAQQH